MGKLKVEVAMANIKNLNVKDYAPNSSDRKAYVVVELNGVKHQTKEVHCPTLDPKWEEIFEFDNVNNPLTDQVVTEFWFAGKKLTDFKFGLSALKLNKFTFRGMPVLGGKVDFNFTALDFGEVEQPKKDAEPDEFSLF